MFNLISFPMNFLSMPKQNGIPNSCYFRTTQDGIYLRLVLHYYIHHNTIDNSKKKMCQYTQTRQCNYFFLQTWNSSNRLVQKKLTNEYKNYCNIYIYFFKTYDVWHTQRQWQLNWRKFGDVMIISHMIAFCHGITF